MPVGDFPCPFCQGSMPYGHFSCEKCSNKTGLKENDHGLGEVFKEPPRMTKTPSKICSKCKANKFVSEFYSHKQGKYGVTACCRVCERSRKASVIKAKKDGTFKSKVRLPRLTLEDKQKRKEEASKYYKEWRAKNSEYVKQKKREYYKNLKLAGIKHYGGKCSCCGEDTIEFLTLEHLEGRKKTAKKKKTGVKAWEEAKSLGWPDTLTVLCFNCNCAKGAFGICPHQKKKL